MAETSGFFQAMIDEKTGDYDRKYIAREFANYFALFVKNGVFGSPTNQLRVSPGTGLSISVAPGNAFIKGMWYNNSSNKNIVLVPNYTSSNRVDTVRVRMDDVTRAIRVDVYTGDTELVRTEDIYDLQIATVTVKPNATSITAAEIQDTRPNEAVCGFVTQLLRVETTADLFAQYQAEFDQWFAKVQETLDENTAGNLQNQIDDVVTNLGKVETNVSDLLILNVANEKNINSLTPYDSSWGNVVAIPPGTTSDLYGYYYIARLTDQLQNPSKIKAIEILWFSKGYETGIDRELYSTGKLPVNEAYNINLVHVEDYLDGSVRKQRTYKRIIHFDHMNRVFIAYFCQDEDGKLASDWCIPYMIKTYRESVTAGYYKAIMEKRN